MPCLVPTLSTVGDNDDGQFLVEKVVRNGTNVTIGASDDDVAWNN